MNCLRTRFAGLCVLGLLLQWSCSKSDTTAIPQDETKSSDAHPAIPASPETHPAAMPSTKSSDLSLLPSEDETYSLAGLRRQHQGSPGVIERSDISVLVSFFSHGEMSCIQHCWVRTDGKRGMIRFVQNWAVQGSGDAATQPGVSMPTAQREALDSGIRQLPPDQPFTKDADAFLVSWNDAGTWHARTFDRTKLPPDVLRLCDLVGIPTSWF